MIFLLGRFGWKGILYWSVCILLLRVISSESSSGFYLERKRTLDRRSTSLHEHTHLLTKRLFCAACGGTCVRPNVPHPNHTGHRSGWNEPSLCNDNFTVNLQDEGLTALFFTGQFHALVCDRTSLHPHWAEASLVVNASGMIQGITGGMSFRTAVPLLLPLLCWVSCLQTKIPKSAITKWIFFYWDLAICGLFCPTAVLLF